MNQPTTSTCTQNFQIPTQTSASDSNPLLKEITSLSYPKLDTLPVISDSFLIL